MTIDLVVLAVLAAAGWHGWMRGTLLMLLATISIFAGYVAAVLFYKPAGALLVKLASVPPLLAAPVGALAVMLLVGTALKIATWKVERSRAVARREGAEPSQLDGIGGATIGVVRAALLVVIGAWLALALHQYAHVGPDISRSLTGRATAAITRKIRVQDLARRLRGSADSAARSLPQPTR